MRHAFERITLTVSKVITRVDAPLVTRLVVLNLANAIDNWIAHI